MQLQLSDGATAVCTGIDLAIKKLNYKRNQKEDSSPNIQSNQWVSFDRWIQS